MKQVTQLITKTSLIILGTLFPISSAQAYECNIAVTTDLEYIFVSIPNHKFNGKIPLGRNKKLSQRVFTAKGDCPSDPEILFEVHDCMEELVYDFKTLPKEKSNNINLYRIGRPSDDEFDGKSKPKKC